MSLKAKKFIIGVLGLLFLVSLVFVQWMEVIRKREEAGIGVHEVHFPDNSKACIECHRESTPGIIDHWTGSTHAAKGVACVECHQAEKDDADSYDHYGEMIATVVTPMDCGRCHQKEYEQFTHSHHAKAGNILASLDNFLAETVEGHREPFNAHSPTPGMNVDMVNGMASVNVGCRQCHGSKVGLQSTDGGVITVDDLKPDENGKPTNQDVVAKIARDEKDGRPILDANSWPNTGIGRLNLDGSLGSCSACHSRHDFSPRRARQPENCGKCHLGPDHPQKEIYEESKHGVAFRDLKDQMNLNSATWVLGEDYTQAPTCATCHMSAHSNGGEVTHDPAERISWTNRPPVSLKMDTDRHGKVIKEKDPAKRSEMLATIPDDELQEGERQPSMWQEKRDRMENVCLHCHTQNYVNAFYKQYDDFVVNYNEKFAKPGSAIMAELYKHDLITSLVNEKTGKKYSNFDEEIEWTWFYLWHHEGRRARHGASMMAPDYAHWHGMYEVAERFYQELIPQALEICEVGEEHGNVEGAEKVRAVIQGILDRPEHVWFQAEKKKLHAAAHDGPDPDAIKTPPDELDKPNAPDEPDEPDDGAKEGGETIEEDAAEKSVEETTDETEKSGDEP